MEKCNLTQVPCRKAIMDVVQANKDRRSLQHIYELAELFRIACSSNEAFMELSEEDQERFWLIIDALMMNDLEDLKRVHNLLLSDGKRIKDNVKVAEHNMDYKKEIENFLNEIQSEKFLKFLYNVIVSFKKQWGTNMDYKKETIEILQKVNDDSLLEFFYRIHCQSIKEQGKLIWITKKKLLN